MNEKHQSYDYIILGAGIIGLAIARELRRCDEGASILVIEKEARLGCHGSGRNSGVLHSGIYYPEGSLKAKCCAEGARAMRDYCVEHGLPLSIMGKVVLPTSEEDDKQIDLLYQRGVANGATVSIIDRGQLKKIEPEAYSISGRALYSPDTAVVDAKVVLQHLKESLKARGVVFLFSAKLEKVDPDFSCMKINGQYFYYGHLFNATGQHADRVAHQFKAAKEYTLIPFKGMYYRLNSTKNLLFNGLIYPVPDLNVPFLGVHSLKAMSGDIYFGPNAFPAFGRENYNGLNGLKLLEAVSIGYHLFNQYRLNKQDFRAYAHRELRQLRKKQFITTIQKLVPNVTMSDLVLSDKVGIRAQLLNKKTKNLEMDFIVLKEGNTTHVLNAVSPAFTCSFSFARSIVSSLPF